MPYQHTARLVSDSIQGGERGPAPVTHREGGRERQSGVIRRGGGGVLGNHPLLSTVAILLTPRFAVFFKVSEDSLDP